MVTYRFQHPSGVVMVTTGETSGGICPEVEHKPWILSWSLELVMKFPTSIPDLLLPLHFKVRILSIARPQVIQIICATEASSHHRAISQQLRFLMVKNWLVHTPNTKAWEAPWEERLRLLAILGAEAGAWVIISIFKHDGPELPWPWSVLHLTQWTQIELLLCSVKVRVVQGLQV